MRSLPAWLSVWEGSSTHTAPRKDCCRNVRKWNGSGRGLRKEAVLRAYRASKIVGSRAIVTHAKGEAAKNFYGRFQFVPSPRNELHLIS